MKKLLLFPLLPLLCASCTPAYTWGYAATIHPKAIEAYIQAILARENGDIDAASDYYDEALRYTYSQRVVHEKKELNSHHP